MNINHLIILAHENAFNKGFWDNPPEIGTSVALIHSELSEALEAARRDECKEMYINLGKPEGFIVELADAVIRIADLCGYYQLDLEQAIIAKMYYNSERKRLHGKKF